MLKRFFIPCFYSYFIKKLWDICEIDLLQVYLKNGGDPNICDENEQSLIDFWYYHKGDCPAVKLLEEYGAKKSPDARTHDEVHASILDMLKRAEEDPVFGAELQAKFDKAMNEKREE